MFGLVVTVGIGTVTAALTGDLDTVAVSWPSMSSAETAGFAILAVAGGLLMAGTIQTLRARRERDRSPEN